MKIFDAHISGSLSVSSSAEISNNLLVSGNLTVLGTVSGNISGSITNADTANRLANKEVTEFATTGSNYFKGGQTFSGSLIPSGSELFDLGSSTNRWRDLFLAGSTINLGGTKLTKDGSGNVQIKDSNNNLKNIITNEVQIGEGANSIVIKRDPSSGYFRLAGETQPFIAAQLSGSFTGSGTGLYGIPASGITGLNLSQIAEGSSTASISSTNGLRVNTNTEITGALTISGSISLNGVPVGTGKLDEITFNSYTSSNDSTNSTQSSRLTSIESATGSLNSFTSSIDTTIKNKLNTETVISGSVQVLITGTTGYSTFSSSISTSIGSLSSSVATTTSGLSSSIGSLSSSVDSLSSSIATTTSGLSSSIATTTSGLSSSIGSLSSSVATTTSELSSSIVSLSSSVATTTSGLSSSLSSSIGSLSSSVATTTSGLSSSIATTTSGLSSSIGSLSSSVATTTLGTKNRVDSIESKTGSYATTGSNIFQGNQTITGSLYVSQDLIIAGSSSIQHISSSIVNIADNIITVNASNPSLRFGGLAVIDSGSSPQVSGSILFDSIENQWIFIHQNQATVTSSMLIMGPETYDNVGNETHLTLNRLVKSLNDEHIGDSNITDTGTKVSINSDTEVTGTLKVTGNITNPNITAIESATGSLNTFTSSINTTIKSKLDSEGVISGSIQVNHNATTNYVANQHIDHTTVSITAGSGLTGGGDISTTRTINVGAGNGITVNADDIAIDTASATFTTGVKTKMNTDTVMSGSYLGTATTANLSENASYLYYTDARVKTKLNAEGVVSGSAQITLSATTGYGSVINQALLTTSTPTFSTVSATTFTGALSGNATTATALTSMNISQFTNNSGYLTSITSGNVTTALGYTPYNATNPNGYITGINSSAVTTALGYTPYNATNPSGYISSITSGNVTTALGYTPYNATNPNGYITSDSTKLPLTGGTLSTTNTTETLRIVNGGTGYGLYLQSDAYFQGDLKLQGSLKSPSYTYTLPGATGTLALTSNIPTNNNQLTNGAGYITGISFDNVSSKPTTISGYGITDAITTGNIGSQSVSYASTAGNAATVTNATFYRQFTVRDDRSDGNDYSLANRPTGLYAITSTGSNGPGSTYSSLIHVANGTDVAFQIAGGYTSDSMYFRGTSALQSGSGYTAWRTVIHSGNYGSYALPLGGGAMTGNITFTNTSSLGTQDVSGTAWFRPRDPSNNLHIYTSSGGIFLDTNSTHYFRNVAGTNRLTLDTSGNAVLAGVFTENSSLRYKKDIETVKYGLDKVLQMRGVTYVRKDSEVKEIGVIAEEMNEILPDIVLKNEEGQVDSVSYGRLSAVFIEAIKELKQEINEQNLIISELKSKLDQ